MQSSNSWSDTAQLRSLLPSLDSIQIQTPLSAEIAPLIEDYRAFYKLNFETPHQYSIAKFESDHFELVAQIFQPENSKGTLFIYHGYMDHLGLFRFPIELGLQAGFTVVGFDLPGHGLSSGPFASIDCFSRYKTAQSLFIEHLSDLNNAGSVSCPRPWCALGQSTGGAVIIDSGVPHYQGAILMAPLVRVHNWLWTRILYQALRHRGGVVRKFLANSGDTEFLDFLQNKDPLQHRRIEALWVGAMIRYTKRILKYPKESMSPLVLQGNEDKTVDFAFNMKYLQRHFTNPKIVMLPGAKHHLANESKAYKKVIADEINVYLERLGTSALSGK